MRSKPGLALEPNRCGVQSQFCHLVPMNSSRSLNLSELQFPTISIGQLIKLREDHPMPSKIAGTH